MLTSGKINEQEYIIIGALQMHPNATSRDLARYTELERSSVTGRLNGLEKKNIVDGTNHVTCSITTKTVKAYRLK